MMADFTFGQQLVLDLLGPVTTALLGTLAVGLFAQWITRRAQERRAANDLRNDLITGMSQIASRLYMQTRHFGRAVRLNSGVAEEREKLDNQYIGTRVDGAVLEQRLRAYFDGENPSESDTTRPAILWHSTIDLLTVRYFDITGQADDIIRRDNSKDYQGKYHSGLSADELKDEQLVLRAYENRLAQATNSVLSRRIERLGTGPGAAKS